MTQVRVVLQSELIANEELPPSGTDPRAGYAPPAPMQSEVHESTDKRAVLVHRTAMSGLYAAVAMRHELYGPDPVKSSSEAFEDVARLVVAATLEPGQSLAHRQVPRLRLVARAFHAGPARSGLRSTL